MKHTDFQCGTVDTKEKKRQNGKHALTIVRLLPLIIVGKDWFLAELL